MRQAPLIIAALLSLAAGAARAETSLADGQDLVAAAFAASPPSSFPQGELRLMGTEVASFHPRSGAFIDTIRLTPVEPNPALGPASAMFLAGAPQRLNLSYVRNWPAALSLEAGSLSLDVTPHTGFGFDAGGGQSLEAGALVKLQETMLRAVGVDGAMQRAHLFLFAAASAKAVGVNLLRGATSLNGAEDGFINDSEVGLGLQRGALQAALSMRQERTLVHALGDETRVDNRIGLTLSIH